MSCLEKFPDDAIALLDANSRIVIYNEILEERLGTPGKELHGELFTSLLPTIIAQEVSNHLVSTAEATSTYQSLEIQSTTFRDSQGKFTGAILIVKESTASKTRLFYPQPNELLAESSAIKQPRVGSQSLEQPGQRYNAVVQGVDKHSQEFEKEQKEKKIAAESQFLIKQITDLVPLIIYLFDFPTNRTLYINREVTALLGYEPEELIVLGKNMLEQLVHPDDLHRLKLHLARFDRMPVGTMKELEYRMKSKHGVWRWFHSKDVLFKHTPDGKVSQLLGCAQEITVRKETEASLLKLNDELERRVTERTEALSSSEERFQLISRATNDAIRDWNFMTNEVWWNASFAKLFGFTPSDIEPGIDFWYSQIHPEDLERVAASLQKALQEKESKWSEEYRFKRADGSYANIHDRNYILYNEQQQVCRILGSMTDVTEARSIRESLRTTVEEYFSLIVATSQIVWMSDQDGKPSAKVNENLLWLRYTGQSHQELWKKGWESTVHPDDQLQFAHSWQEAIRYKRVFEAEYRLRGKDGSYRYFLYRGVPILTRQGRIRKWIGTCTDVHDQKMAEQALHESERHYRFMTDAIPTVIWTARPDGSVDYHNQLWTEYSGIMFDSAGPAGGQPYIHPEDLPATRQAWQESIRTGNAYRMEHRIRRKDGVYRWFITIAMPFRNEKEEIVKWFGTTNDIDDEKKAEEKLRHSEAQYRFLTESMPCMIWTTLPDGRVDYRNRWMYDFTGLTPDKNADRQAWLSTIHPDDAQPSLQTWLNSLQSGRSLQIEYRLKRASDGAYIWHMVCAFPFKNKQGEISKWIGLSIDIDDQKRVVQTLRDNELLRITERRLQQEIADRKEAEKIAEAEKAFSENLIDTIADGIFVFDRELRITSWNQTMELNTKKSRSKATGLNVFKAFREFSKSKEGKSISRVLEGNKITLYNQAYRFKNGYYVANLIPLHDEQRMVNGGLCIIHDVTELRKLEEGKTAQKLLQQKEVLNAILKTQEEERKRISEALHNGLGQLLYAVKLNLEYYEHATAPRDNSEEAQLTLTKTQSLLAEAIKETRTISFELMPTILEDFGLETTLHDLVRRIENAGLVIHCEVIGLQDRLNSALEMALYRIVQELLNNVIKHAQATQAVISLTRKKRHLILRVEDNGIGFDSSKKVSQGMGLPSIRNRVKLLDGTLNFDSAPGRGTLLTILLPLQTD